MPREPERLPCVSPETLASDGLGDSTAPLKSRDLAKDVPALAGHHAMASAARESDSLPWVCSECSATLCSPETSEAAVTDALLRHVLSVWEQERRDRIPSGRPWRRLQKLEGRALPPIKAKTKALSAESPRADSTLVPCPKCGAAVERYRVQKHVAEEHSLLGPTQSTVASSSTTNYVPPKTSEVAHFAPLLVVHRLPFVLLPPGTWDIQQVIDHYRKISHNLSAGLKRRKVDWSRLEGIKSLHPLRCHIGEESWLGYVIFGFAETDHVVLECPIEGNAAYILPGNWEEMVGQTKGEIRREFAGWYKKIVHKGDWLCLVREALRRSRHVR